MRNHDKDKAKVLKKQNSNNAKNANYYFSNTLKVNEGIQAVLKLKEFRKLWIAQIFSQLADKFYIVLMIYLIVKVI